MKNASGSSRGVLSSWPAGHEDWIEDRAAVGMFPTLIVLSLIGAALFAAYAETVAPLFPSCDPLGAYRGGSVSSVMTAARLGIALWLAAGVAARLFPRRRTLVLCGFLVLYGLGLILLGTVIAPRVWGPRVCV